MLCEQAPPASAMAGSGQGGFWVARVVRGGGYWDGRFLMQKKTRWKAGRCLISFGTIW